MPIIFEEKVDSLAGDKIKGELELIAQEHVDLSSEQGSAGFGLYVFQDQDHDLHLFHHIRFLEDPPKNLRIQDIQTLKNHIDKHKVAKSERNVLGLERAFNAAFNEIME